MGFFFNKRIKILPGITMNISKSGVSWSLGVRGAKVNISKRGTYLTGGIPGTGIYAREKLFGKNYNNKKCTQISSEAQKRIICLNGALSEIAETNNSKTLVSNYKTAIAQVDWMIKYGVELSNKPAIEAKNMIENNFNENLLRIASKANIPREQMIFILQNVELNASNGFDTYETIENIKNSRTYDR